MAVCGSQLTVSLAVRTILGGGTVVSLAVAVMARDGRWFAASAGLGIIWWGWDLLVGFVLQPLGDWLFEAFAGGAVDGEGRVDPLTLDDTIRLLESHLEHRTSQKVDLNSAIRLEEIYRTVKQDPERARRVIATVLERYPDAPELERYREGV